MLPLFTEPHFNEGGRGNNAQNRLNITNQLKLSHQETLNTLQNARNTQTHALIITGEENKSRGIRKYYEHIEVSRGGIMTRKGKTRQTGRH